LQSIWPKARDRVTPAIADSFARLAIETRDEFPSALRVLRPFLLPLQHADFAIRRLDESGLCATFASEALELMAVIVNDQVPWLPTRLESCLNSIAAASPQLAGDTKFQRLSAYVRRNQ
jgi:hypothetical protein